MTPILAADLENSRLFGDIDHVSGVQYVTIPSRVVTNCE